MGVENNLLHEGSVKNIFGVKGKSPYVFQYSNRYSIFDWGEMPDHLKGKGKSLAFMAHFFFEYLGNPLNWKNWFPDILLSKSQRDLLRELRDSGVSHHYLSDYDAHGEKSDEISVTAVNVYRPELIKKDGKSVYEYSLYQKNQFIDALVPLEVIFRFGVPQGSSLLKRTKDENYLKEIGLDKAPEYGDKFETPVVEMSTKLESTDRYLSKKDAQFISGMNDEEFEKLQSLTTLLALRLKDLFLELGIELWDGKFEFAFIKGQENSRNFMLVDSIGPDELRLTYKGMSFSKENLRQFYQESEWKKNVDLSKDIARKRGETNWKDICLSELKSAPENLKENDLLSMEMMYKSLANTLSMKFTSRAVFPNAWGLDELRKSISNESSENSLNNGVVLIVGSGGREHALAKKIAESSLVRLVNVFPGNPGMDLDPSKKIKSLGGKLTLQDLENILIQSDYDFIIIGPEGPLVQGWGDFLKEKGHCVIAPSFKAAKIEGSKIFAKQLMAEYDIPSAPFEIFSSSVKAIQYLNKLSSIEKDGIVVKADELAGGKGVVVTNSKLVAEETVLNFLENPNYLVKSKNILIEKCLKGREISVFALCDGENFKILGHACDYKRAYDKNLGPNTGGMGAYIPNDLMSDELMEKIKSQIFSPILKAMKNEGHPYFGVLFAGLMIDEHQNPFVIEFNARFGDPETQVILPFLDEDLYQIFTDFLNGKLYERGELNFKKGSALHVVMVSDGYPSLEKTRPMLLNQKIKFNMSDFENSFVYFSGVKKQNGHLVNSGGRVVGVTILDENLDLAKIRAYEVVKKIDFQGARYRNDIGTVY